MLPFEVRLALIRLARLPAWTLEHHLAPLARRHADSRERTDYTHLLAEHRSPLRRGATVAPPRLQLGKETNVTIAATTLDGLVIEPFQVFSYHHTVGRPTRRRGFEEGLELRDEGPAASIGGGLCQVSNGLHWAAVNAGMKIIERHRHGLDLFPDDQRTVPFGAGATVVFNYADLRFENPLPTPVMLTTRVEDGTFVVQFWTTRDPGWTVDVSDVDHRFFRRDGNWYRENRIRRRIEHRNGSVLVDEEIVHNVARVMYEPNHEDP